MKKIFSFVFAFCFGAGLFAQPQIVAHRGYWNCEEGGYARNSIASLKAAQDHGFWGSEFDVNMTADGQLLVFHDGKIDGKVIEKTPAADFAYYRLVNGETIPTLDEYLEQGARGKAVLVFEIKKHSSPEVEAVVCQKSIEALKAHGLFDPSKVVFISFSSYVCEYMAQHCPDFSVSYLGIFPNVAKLAAAGVSGIDSNYNLLTPGLVRKARANGMSINAWTVNSDKAIEKVAALGIDFITTDNPHLAREILK